MLLLLVLLVWVQMVAVLRQGRVALRRQGGVLGRARACQKGVAQLLLGGRQVRQAGVVVQLERLKLVHRLGGAGRRRNRWLLQLLLLLLLLVRGHSGGHEGAELLLGGRRGRGGPLLGKQVLLLLLLLQLVLVVSVLLVLLLAKVLAHCKGRRRSRGRVLRVQLRQLVR